MSELAMRNVPAIVWWLLAYLATMAAIVLGLQQAQRVVVERMNDPAARAAWQAWRDDTNRPLAPGQAVERRPVKSDEPPSLVLMRDYFFAIQVVSVVIGSFLFAFLSFLARGLWRQRGRSYADTDPPATDPPAAGPSR